MNKSKLARIPQKKNSSAARKDSVDRLGITPLFIFFLGYAFLIRYWFDYSKYQLNSDAFVPDALAASILKHGSLIPSEFAYANGDFLVYYHHTFLVFLSSIFPSAATAHNFASMILGTIFLFSIFIFVRELGASINRTLLILALISTGLSSQITDWLFGQAGYSAIITMNLLFLTAFLRIVKEFNTTKNTRIRFQLILLVVLPLGVVLLTNPFRFITSFAIPLAFAIFVVLPSPESSFRMIFKLITRNFLPLFFTILPFLVCRILFEIRSSSIAGIIGTGFRDYNNFLDGLKNIVVGTVQLFGLLPAPGTSLFTISSMISIVRIATVILIFQGLMSLLSSEKGLGGHRFVWTFTKSALYLQFLILMFTNISIDISCGRYFLPQLLVILLFVLAKWELNFLSTLKGERVIAAIILSLFGLASVYTTTHLDKSDYTSRMQLVQRLDDLGVSAVNATYWHSARNQNLADNRITFNTIFLDPGNCISEYWWVNDREPIDKLAPLVLTKPEYDFVSSNANCVDDIAGANIQQVANYFIILKN